MARHRLRRARFLATVLAASFGGPAYPQVVYVITDLGVLPATPGIYEYAVNGRRGE